MTDAEVDTKPVMPPSPPKTWDVTKFALRLDALILQDMHLDHVHIDDTPIPASKLDSTSTLVTDSIDDTSFSVRLSWNVLFEDGKDKPFSLSGEHLLKFKHKEGLSAEGALYYATVNTLIFAYPYLRQLVNEIASWTVGKSLILEPLDVPLYVREREKVFREEKNTGTQSLGAIDDQEVQGKEAG